jgi:hypothetical protein
MDGDATAGGAAHRGRLAAPPALQARRRVPGARLADWNGRGGRRVWTPRERSHGAVGDALGHRRRPRSARAESRAAQWPLGGVLGVASATASSPSIWHLRPGAGAPRSPGAATGGVTTPIHRFWSHSNETIWSLTKYGRHRAAFLARMFLHSKERFYAEQ